MSTTRYYCRICKTLHGEGWTCIKSDQMTYEQATELIGKRIELPMCFDVWMQGAKYGKILAVKHGFNQAHDYMLVELDKPKLGYIYVVTEHWDYIRVID